MNSNDTAIMFGILNNIERRGDVFTSPVVVRFMLDMVGYTDSRDLRDIRVLEPSCGEGEFIVEIARRLQRSATLFQFDADAAFNKNVRAYDIDKVKIDRCRKRIREIGFFCPEKSIFTGDFLKVAVGKADIIIGNPPYIRYEDIPQEMIKHCQRSFRTFYYRCDLYVPFFEKTLSSLDRGGIHCFICSNRWMKNEYGKKLRQLIAAKYSLKRIINMEQVDAFQSEVLAYPAITEIRNERPDVDFLYAECRHIDELEKLYLEKRCTPSDADWTATFNNASSYPTFQTIEQQGFKIGIGVATGADSIFVSKELPQKVEAERIMPGINARDLRGNHFQWQGKYLLNPYNADGTLVNLSEYPLTRAYLELHRERLSARHIAQKSPSRWYKTIDKIHPRLLSQPKILLPDMSSNTFVFVDDGAYYPLHNIYYITGKSFVQLQVLAAFLMSDFIRNQLLEVTNRMKGGFPRWQSQHLRKLRLPVLNLIPDDAIQKILAYYECKNIGAINDCINSIINECC